MPNICRYKDLLWSSSSHTVTIFYKSYFGDENGRGLLKTVSSDEEFLNFIKDFYKNSSLTFEKIGLEIPPIKEKRNLDEKRKIRKQYLESLNYLKL